MKKAFLFVLSILTCSLLLTACGGETATEGNTSNGGNTAVSSSQTNSAGDSIVGTWTGEEAGETVTYTFSANGTFNAGYASGTYTLADGKITMVTEINGTEIVLFDGMPYSVNGNTLTIDSYTYQKQ